MNEVKDQQFLVTGGAGAIGSRLVERLLQQGAKKVVVVDDLSSGYRWLLPESDRLELHIADVRNIDSLDLGLKRPTVFHLAAFFANQNSVDHPQDDLDTNGKGTLASLEWSAKSEVRRFVYASAGCSIAGHGLDEPIREDMPVSLFLDTPYQITKALGEFYCNYFNPQVGTVRARFFNSYGPGEVPGTYRNVIPNFIWLAMKNEPLMITGTGEETRDFIFVDDLVSGLICLAFEDNVVGRAFNLGTGRQTRVVELAKMIIDAVDSKSSIQYGPKRPWDKSDHREADISRIQTELGFKAETRVVDGVQQTAEWFQKNFDQIARSTRALA